MSQMKASNLKHSYLLNLQALVKTCHYAFVFAHVTDYHFILQFCWHRWSLIAYIHAVGKHIFRPCLS